MEKGKPLIPTTPNYRSLLLLVKSSQIFLKPAGSGDQEALSGSHCKLASQGPSEVGQEQKPRVPALAHLHPLSETNSISTGTTKLRDTL